MAFPKLPSSGLLWWGVQSGRQGQEQQEAEGWEGGVFGGKATRNPGRGSSGAHSCAGRCGVNAGPL